jgi:RecA/RadA recombinase
MPKKLSALFDSDSTKTRPDTYISSNNFKLDMSLGGGYPTGVITGIMGPYGSGKTTMAVHGAVAALAKYPNMRVLYILTEAGGISNSRCEQLGLDLSKVDFVSSTEVEYLCKELQSAKGEFSLKRDDYCCIIVDSVHSLTNSSDDSAEGVGYSKSPQYIKKFMKVINSHLEHRNSMTDKIPAPLVMCLLQVSVDLDTYSGKEYSILGGEYLKHILDTTIVMKGKKLRYTPKGELRIDSTTTLSMPYLAKHPDMYMFKESNSPFTYVKVITEKERGTPRHRFSFLTASFTLSMTEMSPEKFWFKQGREVIGYTYLELLGYYGLIDASYSVPSLDMPKTRKDAHVNRFLFGVYETEEDGVFGLIDYIHLEKFLAVLMRYEMFRINTASTDNKASILPSDKYLCGHYFDNKEFEKLYAKVIEIKNKTEPLDMAGFLNEYL